MASSIKTRRFILLLGTLLLLGLWVAAVPAPATKPTLDDRVAALEAKMSALQSQVTALQGQVNAQAALIAALQDNPVMALGPYVSVDPNDMDFVKGPNIVFQGCNVHVRSSTDETDASGLGNLIVGWDDVNAYAQPGCRAGSNNLVVGINHYFTGTGCFVAGASNAVSGPYASISGGEANQALSWASSVSGGASNQATGKWTSVSGGLSNVAGDDFASVSGGWGNHATGKCTSVSGGSTLSLGVPYGWAAGSPGNPQVGAFEQLWFLAP